MIVPASPVPVTGLQKEAQAEIKSPAGTPRGKVEGLNHNRFFATTFLLFCSGIILICIFEM